MGIFDRDTILELRRAAITARLSNNREALLAGLRTYAVATLTPEADPGEQVLLDLDALNEIGMLADGSVPLAVWLKNATAIAAARTEARLFSTLLDRINPTTGSRCRTQLDASARIAGARVVLDRFRAKTTRYLGQLRDSNRREPVTGPVEQLTEGDVAGLEALVKDLSEQLIDRAAPRNLWQPLRDFCRPHDTGDPLGQNNYNRANELYYEWVLRWVDSTETFLGYLQAASIAGGAPVQILPALTASSTYNINIHGSTIGGLGVGSGASAAGSVGAGAPATTTAPTTQPIELTLTYNGENASRERHDYELVVCLNNTGTKRIDDWEIEVAFPTPLLDTIDPRIQVVERSDGSITLFRLVGREPSKSLRPGDGGTLRLGYFMNREIFRRGGDLLACMVRVRALVDGEIAAQVERPIIELQNFWLDASA